MIDSEALIIPTKNVVESFGHLKIQDKLKRAVYHSLIMIVFYVSHTRKGRTWYLSCNGCNGVSCSKSHTTYNMTFQCVTIINSSKLKSRGKCPWQKLLPKSVGNTMKISF